MQSNICKIENGKRDLSAILEESEKVAVYNGLDKKQSLHLRLICEELDGMLPEIVGDFDGNLWIDFVDGVCKVNVSVEIREMNRERRNELIGIAKNGKNAAATGIVGKIRSTLEGVALDEYFTESFSMTAAGIDGAYMQYGDAIYTHYWSLDKYKQSVEPDDGEKWDELEKSVIANLADDVIVGVKGRRTDIVIVKKFS